MNSHLNKTRFIAAIAVSTSLVMVAAGCIFGNSLSASAASYVITDTYEECLETSRSVNKRLMEEGMVLLKNENGALPLAKNAKVSLFGTGSYFTLWGETGSGNGKTDYVYMKDSLEDAGFSVNPDVAGIYNAMTAADQTTIGGVSLYKEIDTSKLAGAESSYSAYGDAAIITFSRTGKESGDLETSGLQSNGWSTDSDHQLMLTANEKALIEYVTAKFSKVVVLINCPTSMQIPELQSNDKIQSIMYIGMPGQYGLEALGGVLNGTVNPSGRLVTTWTADFTKDPSYQNAITNTDEIDGTMSVEYEEGIYLGYKYYETAYAEALNGNYEGFDYDSAVVYPFGYGLSYTTFTQSFAQGATFTIPDNVTLDTYIDVDVTVNNTGTVAGKDVVQIYNHAPYVKNGMEKAEVVLVGFAKTDTIEAGQSCTITVSIRVGDLVSFDYSDANGDGFYGYELEALSGYELRLSESAHTTYDTLSYTVGATLAFNNDGSMAQLPAASETNVENIVFSTGDDFDSTYLVSSENGGDFKSMSRADFASTFPTSPTGNNNYKSSVPEKYSSAFTPDMDTSDDIWYVSADKIPSDWTQGANGDYVFSDMIGVDYTSDVIIEDGIWKGKTGSEAWTLFMNQLTWDELKTLVRTGAHLTAAVPSIYKAAQADKDGPEQLGDGTFWACANIIAGTFNLDLIEERGVAIGNEALYEGLNGWYGPTANLNRSPFGGRNVIYSSEDSLLAGKVAAANIKGAQSRGLVCYVKHFALNEQETGRSGIATFLTEQALRETYLKAFEYAVKEGETLGIMQAMNRVGAVNSFGNYALDVTVLREEWGFKGCVLTDAYSANLVRENMAQRMGGDIPLGSWTVPVAGDWDAAANMVTYEGEASPTQWYVIRNSAMHVLYMSVNSSVTANGYNVSSVTSMAYDGNLTFSLNEQVSIDASIDTEKFGTSNISYSAINLPEGLSIDPKTGQITGTPTQTTPEKNIPTVYVTINVLEEGETWISARYTLGKIVIDSGDGNANSDMGLGAGAIAGIVVGCIAVVAIAGAVIFLVIRKRNSNK